MNTVVSMEHRFDRTPDGVVWTQTAYAYDFFWAHYLQVFDGVRVIARVREVESVPGDFKRADGPAVSFAALPYYIGPWQYLASRRRIRRIIRDAIGPEDAVIMRVPSAIAPHLERVCRAAHRPYGVQVVGDPYDVFAPGSVDHPLRAFFRWSFSRDLRRQCAGAAAACYVTREALQRRYPCESYSCDASDVHIPAAALVQAARPPAPGKRSFAIVTVGSLEQLYKGPDVLLDAVAQCVRGGLDVSLRFVGDGKFRPQLEAQRDRLGLGGRAEFLGLLPAGEAVRAEYDRADLFVLPSRTEGLPRAMIEAMARGVPCVGSNVGGIPELLAAEDLVEPGDVAALARKITEVLSNPQRLSSMSARNLARAGEYRNDVLFARRIDFYGKVREATERWLVSHGGAQRPDSTPTILHADQPAAGALPGGPR